jgi:hypothetical protein
VDRWRAAGRFGRRHRRHDRRRALVVGRAVPGPGRGGAGGIGPDVPGAALRFVAIGIRGLLPLRVADGALRRHHPVGAAGPVRVRVPGPGAAVRAPELAGGRIVGAAHVSIGIGIAEQVGVAVTFAVTVVLAVVLAVTFAVVLAVAVDLAVVVGPVVAPAVDLGPVVAAAVDLGPIVAPAVDLGPIVAPAVVLGPIVRAAVVCAGPFAVMSANAPAISG